MKSRAFAGRMFGVVVFAIGLCSLGSAADGAVVRFTTVLGNFDVRLYQTATPISVSNFLGYVTRGDYTNGIIHRSTQNSGFWLIQGGGYRFDGGPAAKVTSLIGVTPQPAIPDEVKIPNTRGTLACAKGKTNSQTSQWFVNLTNAPSLDVTNNPTVGAFTVFGRVLGSGMNIVDALAALPIYDASGAYTPATAFHDMPLRNFVSSVYGSNLVSVAITQLNYRDGDYNFDGQVNMADLCLAHTKLGSTTEAEADGNGDGVVDAEDLKVWGENVDAGPAALIRAIKFKTPVKLANGAVQIGFTNSPGLCLSVLTSTNLSLSASNWTRLGDALETGAGTYQFTDSSATNSTRRFYRIGP